MGRFTHPEVVVSGGPDVVAVAWWELVWFLVFGFGCAYRGNRTLSGDRSHERG